MLRRLPEPERGAQDRAFHLEEVERVEADGVAGLLPDLHLPQLRASRASPTTTPPGARCSAAAPDSNTQLSQARSPAATPRRIAPRSPRRGQPLRRVPRSPRARRRARARRAVATDADGRRVAAGARVRCTTTCPAGARTPPTSAPASTPCACGCWAPTRSSRAARASCASTCRSRCRCVPGDRFVLRESGRDETVGGGEVLDVAPVLPGVEGAARRARSTG